MLCGWTHHFENFGSKQQGIVNKLFKQFMLNGPVVSSVTKSRQRRKSERLEKELEKQKSERKERSAMRRAESNVSSEEKDGRGDDTSSDSGEHIAVDTDGADIVLPSGIPVIQRSLSTVSGRGAGEKEKNDIECACRVKSSCCVE